MNVAPVISPSDLSALLALSGDVVMLDARPDGAAFQRGHLTGAHHAALDTDLSAASDLHADPARGGRHPLPPLDRWLRRLGEWGIGPDTYVVTYDDQAGANAAARAWWMLRSVGHEAVSVLDGGFGHAVEAGLAVSTEVPHVRSLPPYPGADWNNTVDIERIETMRRDPRSVVLDVRSGERFRGETEPIDPVAGHIPGARNLPFSDNLQGGLFKSPEALRDQYRALLDGSGPGQMAVHCGSGVTACHTLLALERAGYPGASLFVGSWSEWCRNDRPQARGE